MPERDLLGERLGPYVVRQRLGQGGMGTVYLAHDTALDRLVALKVLDARYARDQQFIDRFQREARAAAKLNHPNIVQIYSVDLAASPPYIVMEYVNGPSIDKILAAQGPFTWQKALTICGQVAAALACAHEQGIIHRDIKPGNILLDGNGRARVTDFGIAKVLGASTSLTGEQVSIGSPSYMSPEQCGNGKVVPASDLFSLGITLFESLTGKVPYEAETYLGLIKQITQDPLPKMSDSNPNLPVVVQDFVEVLTAKSTGQRYVQAAHVIEDLQALRNGGAPPHLSQLRGKAASLPVVATPSVPAATNPWDGRALVDDLLDGTETNVRRLPRAQAAGVPWAMAATVIGAILLGVAVATLALRRPPPPREEAGIAPPAAAVQAPAEAPAVETPPPPRRRPGQFPPGPPPPAPAGQPQPGEPGYQPPPGYPAPPPPHPGGGFGPPPGGGFRPPPPGAPGGPPPGGGFPPPPPPGGFQGQ